MKLGLLLSATILSGCGGESHIDSKYRPYADRFVADSKAQGHEQSLHGHTIRSSNGNECKEDSGAVGCCHGGTVIIYEKQFAAFEFDEYRELLIYHELGHCVLGRNHRNDVSAGGKPVSIMNRKMVGIEFYSTDRKNYIHELFDN